jgi:flagellar biosynthesis regulator FlaF
MPNNSITPASLSTNLSPLVFRNNARDYLKCFFEFTPHSPSSLPFFLCCRAIELALKSRHLDTKTQKKVKALYWHDLVKAYNDLDRSHQTLSKEERRLLISANKIYVSKEFEYLNMVDVAKNYQRFPDLQKLGKLASKIVNATTCQRPGKSLARVTSRVQR